MSAGEQQATTTQPDPDVATAADEGSPTKTREDEVKEEEASRSTTGGESSEKEKKGGGGDSSTTTKEEEEKGRSGSKTNEQLQQQSSPEEKKAPAAAGVSLRPGGGDASFSYLSLRPGGGDASFSLRPGGGGSDGLFSLRPGGGMMNTPSTFSSDLTRRSGGNNKTSSSSTSGGGGRGRGGTPPRPSSFQQEAGFASKQQQRCHSLSSKQRERKVYTRETILGLKSKCKGMPSQGTMDRIPGVYKVSDEEWRASHGGSAPASASTTSTTSTAESGAAGSGKGAAAAAGSSGGEKWVPPSMRDGLNFTIDQEELRKKKFLESVRHMNGLLNKATPENYDTVAPAVKASFEGAAGDGELLKKHWSLIFEKALSEPNYAFMWGDLCVQLSGGGGGSNNIGFGGTPPGHPDSIYSKFRTAVLNMSQEEFERMQKEFKIPEKEFDKDLYAKKENGTFTDDDVSELEERRVKRKKRRLGTINFIGELFKKKLLNKNLLYLCFGQLLSQNLSELPLEERCHNIEAFCILVTVVGSSLEIGNPKVVPHFQRLESILKSDNELPPRIRFKIEDVIESRQGGWTKVVGNAPQPMKIGMVHANAVKKSGGGSTVAKPEAPKPDKKPETVVPTRSDEELESLCNNLLEEYLASYDANEAVICVTEMNAPYYHSKFVTAAINCILESRSWGPATAAMMKLFVKLKDESLFTHKDFSEGMVPFFSSLADLSLDYPNSPSLIRDLTSELMNSGCLPSSFVTDKFQVLDRSYQKLFFDLMSV